MSSARGPYVAKPSIPLSQWRALNDRIRIGPLPDKWFGAADAPGATAPCWLWTGCVVEGYGYVQFIGKAWRVHKLVWERLFEPVPADYQLDHLCCVKRCCNPLHLEPVTAATNAQRRVLANGLKTHCVHGHRFSPENTYRGKNGSRTCRTCARDYQRLLRAKRKGAA